MFAVCLSGQEDKNKTPPNGDSGQAQSGKEVSDRLREPSPSLADPRSHAGSQPRNFITAAPRPPRRPGVRALDGQFARGKEITERNDQGEAERTISLSLSLTHSVRPTSRVRNLGGLEPRGRASASP